VCAAVIDLEYAVGNAACYSHEGDFALVHARQLQYENVLYATVIVMMIVMVATV
jgi:hypothetical protein